MITSNMTLNSKSDARTWAAQMGDLTGEQIENLTAYIWNNKPEIGCDYEEFTAANPELSNLETFWNICDGKN